MTIFKKDAKGFYRLWRTSLRFPRPSRLPYTTTSVAEGWAWIRSLSRADPDGIYFMSIESIQEAGRKL